MRRNRVLHMYVLYAGKVGGKKIWGIVPESNIGGLLWRLPPGTL